MTVTLMGGRSCTIARSYRLTRTANLYLFGPFPSREVADLIEASMECECKRRVVPLFFPTGVTMMVTALLPDMPMLTDGPVH